MRIDINVRRMAFIRTANEALDAIEHTASLVDDPYQRAMTTNTLLRAKIMELYGKLEAQQRDLAAAITAQAQMAPVQTPASSDRPLPQPPVQQTAPEWRTGDKRVTVCRFRDGSLIERRTRGPHNHWFFSIPSGYIRVRGTGADPFGVAVAPGKLSMYETNLTNMAGEFASADTTPYCVLAYKLITGTPLF